MIKIIKNRSDIGAGTRGSDMGIDAIEIAAINHDSQFFNIYPYTEVPTQNESVYDKMTNPFAIRIGHVFKQCSYVSQKVVEVINDGYFPLVLSGDHSSAIGTLSGLTASIPLARWGVIWIDAHADLHSPFTSPSGNIHGMPLAAILCDDNLDCQIHNIHLAPETLEFWTKLKNLGLEGAKIKYEDLVYIGVRDTEVPEDYQIAKHKIRNYSVPEMRYRSIEHCMEEALSKLSKCDLLYISFDVDSMDCDRVSYGTGTPVARGFDPEEIKLIMHYLIKSKKVACLEVVEINPLLDTHGNRMAETAFEIIEDFTQLWQNNHSMTKKDCIY